jgi:hypothetical protein
VLAFQGVTFKAQNKSMSSTNRENFHEILDLKVLYNEEVAEVIARA